MNAAKLVLPRKQVRGKQQSEKGAYSVEGWPRLLAFVTGLGAKGLRGPPGER